jgi:hypothetical protein
MFDDTKRLRELRRRITSLQGERAALLLIAAGESTMDRRSELVRDITHRTQMLEALESSLIIEQAQRLGIDIPSRRRSPICGFKILMKKLSGKWRNWG